MYEQFAIFYRLLIVNSLVDWVLISSLSSTILQFLTMLLHVGCLRLLSLLVLARLFGLQAFCALMIITALHGMQTRSSDENSVRLSVRLSVCHTREL